MKSIRTILRSFTYLKPTVKPRMRAYALAVLGILGGAWDSEAQRPAVVGRTIYTMVDRKSEGGEYRVEPISAYVEPHQLPTRPGQKANIGRLTFIRKDNELMIRGLMHNELLHASGWLVTNNGVLIKEIRIDGGGGVFTQYASILNDPIYDKNYSGLYLDINEFARNEAAGSAPIGSLMVSPSQDPSEQTTVRWQVQ